jgi:hypothetical protein
MKRFRDEKVASGMTAQQLMSQRSNGCDAHVVRMWGTETYWCNLKH